MPAGADRDSHWDLMFETGASLRTWALAAWPEDQPEVEARLLANHRLDYLTYEGPVSGGRGAVCRWDAGSYVLQGAGDRCWEVELRGARLRGTAVLRRGDEPYCWRLAFTKA